MGLSVVGTKLGNWMTVRSKKKKIRHIEWTIDELNDVLEKLGERVKSIQKAAASEWLEEKHKSQFLECKLMIEECARYAGEKLVRIEGLKKKEMEALEDFYASTTKTATRPLCFHF